MHASRILLTGATGFIGRALCAYLTVQGLMIRVLARDPDRVRVVLPLLSAEICPLQTDEPPNRSVFTGVRTLVHLAGRAHVLRETESDALAAYGAVNRDLTLSLASAAADAGVSRFIFVSTIGVNGWLTYGAPFRESDPPHPHDAYSMSKWEAEKGLWALADKTGLEVVVVRPPLVYGPGVPANFRRLLALAASGVPLPTFARENRRSLVFVGNLVAALGKLLEHPRAAGELFLVSDAEDLSTADLVQNLATGMERRCRLVPIPRTAARLVATALGRRRDFDRLFGSLTVDCSKLHDMLSWLPPFSVNEALRATAEWYMSERSRLSPIV